MDNELALGHHTEELLAEMVLVSIESELLEEFQILAIGDIAAVTNNVFEGSADHTLKGVIDHVLEVVLCLQLFI